MDEPPEQPSFDVEGNRLTLLDTGPRRLAALIDLIENAATNLRVIYYIYSDDDSGKRVRAALIAAAARGVKVSLIVDGFGSDAASDKEFFDPLQDAGAQVCRFVPRWGRRYLLRNHQKLALADEARIIVGGFNVEDDYFGTVAEQAWRDLGLLVEGPAAARLAGYFDALSAWSRKSRAPIRELQRALQIWSEPDGQARWLLSGPMRRQSPWVRVVIQDMRRARMLDIIAAYFAPNPAMLRRIGRVGRRGAVRIVTAAKSDNDATIAAARFTYAGLIRKRVKIFEYSPTKLHTKLFVIDDTVHIGSANFDMRSLYLNLEMMLRIEDRAFAEHVRSYVDGEIAQSEAITAAVHRQRTTPMQRVMQAVAYFVVSVVDHTVSRRLNFGIGSG